MRAARVIAELRALGVEIGPEAAVTILRLELEYGDGDAIQDNEKDISDEWQKFLGDIMLLLEGANMRAWAKMPFWSFTREFRKLPVRRLEVSGTVDGRTVFQPPRDVDANKIEVAIELVRLGCVRGATEEWTLKIQQAVAERESFNINCTDASYLVQISLFGEIRYK